MVRQDDSKWRNWLNWALQRMWVEGTFQKLYTKWYGVEPAYGLGDYGQIQPRVMEMIVGWVSMAACQRAR